MNASKTFIIVSMALLTACAPPRSNVIMDNNPNAALGNQQLMSSGNIVSQTKTHAGLPNSWDLSGAMAARNKSKAWTASVNWLQQGPGKYQIRLFGPLGSGTVMVEKQGANVTFRDGPKTYSSANAEELLSQHTGIRLPVVNLYYWVRGIPAPGAVQMSKKDSANRLTMLKQGGYVIQYLAYTTSGGTTLPTQIRLQGNGVFIKFVIKRWKI